MNQPIEITLQELPPSANALRKSFVKALAESVSAEWADDVTGVRIEVRAG